MKSTAAYNYRPDIDGLRTIAVLAVIAYHAEKSILPSGFVGVDFFFVISGFLITGLIAQAIEAGTFTFADFYARRIKRIFPAFIVVATLTFFVASYLLIPDDYLFYTTSLAAAFAFVSNIFFSMLSWGYFGDRTAEFPLLHSWSLSVEEQFYFFFPIILLGLFRYCRKYALSALVMLGLVCLVISELKVNEPKAYFLITTRAHEMIIGAITFFISRKYPAQNNVRSEIIGWTGLTLMAGSTFLIKDGMTFPGVNSLYPCLGTAMVIYAGQSGNAVSRMLANRIMVSIGLISYSLYLWHWPIFSFLKYRRIDMTLEVGVAAIALTFLLSILTYKYVETPVRRNKSIRFKQAFTKIYALPAAAFLCIGIYSYATNGAPVRFPQETRELISSYSFERDLSHTCSIRPDQYNKVSVEYLNEKCAFGDMAQKKADVLLIGDSHADHFKQFVGELARNAGMRAVYQVQGACLPTVLEKPGSSTNASDATCQRHNADLLELAGNYKYVILAGFWSSEPWRDFEGDLGIVIDKITKSGAIPVVFKDNPNHEPNMSKCVLHRHRGWLPADTNCNISLSYVSKADGASDRVIDRLKARYPQMQVINPKLVMCDKKECVTSIGNTALYKDSNHINPKASQLLGNEYIAKVENPLSFQVQAKRNSTGSASAFEPSLSVKLDMQPQK